MSAPEESKEIDLLRIRLEEAENALEAIRSGGVDAVVVSGPEGRQVFTLNDASHSYRVILETMNEGAATLTSSGDIFYCNSKLAKMLKLPPEKIVGKPVRDFMSAESKKMFEDLFRRGLSGESYGEISFKRHGCALLPAYASISALELDGASGACAVFTDLREQKRQEKINSRTKRLADVGTLSATVAHELRNPLAAIEVAVSNIKRKSSDSKIEKHVEGIRKKISESDQIINNLLFYSRLREPRFEKVNIAKIIRDGIIVSKKHHNGKARVIENYDSVKEVTAEADPLQMTELFANILNNAFDALPFSKGIIEVSALDKGDFVKACVTDNGIGIEGPLIEKICDPFFTTKSKGTGLGLAVCSQIIAFHGGEMQIQSAPGKGTLVTIILPKKQ